MTRPQAVIATVILTLLAILAFPGCPTVDRHVVSLDENDIQELKLLEIHLLDHHFTREKALLDKTERRVRELLAGNIPNREYKALLLGLLGQTQVFKNDLEGLKKTVADIEAASIREQRLYILKAALLKDKRQRIAVLLEGLKTAEPSGLISLTLAELYFDLSEFRSALARYDEAFPALDPRYREYYVKNRDIAFRLIDAPPLEIQTREILTKAEVTVADALVLVNLETEWFSHITEDRRMAPEALLARLKENRFILDTGLNAQNVMKRKDIAVLFLSIIAWLENDPGLLTLHAPKAGRPDNFKSPVPDLSVTDYFYTAALVLVEREIMDLPNGIHFFPNNPLKGSALYEIVKKLKELYR